MTDREGLRALLAPRSIALLGASSDKTKLSGLPLHFLQRHGYRGEIYPIHPRAEEIDGIRCYPTLASIGKPVDLVFVLLGADQTLQSIDACIESEAGAAIIAASGFAEIGEAGARLQAALSDRIAGSRLRVLGPNCMGMVNLREGIAASFSQSLFVDRLLRGGLAFFSQSGAIGGSMLDMATSCGIGLSHWVATGNQVDVDVVECAQAVVDDPDVHTIGLYIEGVRNPRSLIDLLQSAANFGKPVLILKSGRSAAGVKAALSHTGAMAGNVAAFDVVARQHGAILVNDVEELLDCAAAIAPGKRAGGRGVGVVSSSGGVGVILSDLATLANFQVADLEDTTRERLSQVIPSYGSTNNPVDATATLVAQMMAGQSGLWTESFLAVADDPRVDVLIIGLTMITGSAGITLADEVVDATRRTSKPVLVNWLGADLCTDAFARLRQAGVPVFPSSARAIRAATAISPHRSPEGISLPTSVNLDFRQIGESLPEGDVVLTEWECQQLLREARIATPESVLVQAADSALEQAFGLQEPLVVKIQSRDITHKSDIGGVMLNVERANLVSACEVVLTQSRAARPEASILGCLIQEQVSQGMELIVGVTRDAQFGLMLTVGLGGRWVEILKSMSMRHLPVDERDIEEMLLELPLSDLLKGARGAPPADRAALIAAIHSIADLAGALDDRLVELEINPLVVLAEGRGVRAVDCLLQIEASAH